MLGVHEDAEKWPEMAPKISYLRQRRCPVSGEENHIFFSNRNYLGRGRNQRWPAVSFLVLKPCLPPTLLVLCPPILWCCHLGAMRQENHRKTISPGQKMQLLSLKKQRGPIVTLCIPFWTCLATTKYKTADPVHPQWNPSPWYSGWLQTQL